MDASDQPIVIDSSVILSWLFPDEKSDIVDELFETIKQKSPLIIAPSFISLEISNAIWQGVKRKRISLDKARSLILKAKSFPVKLIHPTYQPDQIFFLSSKMQLSAYDVAYVWLAIENSAQLCTLDKQMAKSANQYLTLVSPTILHFLHDD